MASFFLQIRDTRYPRVTTAEIVAAAPAVILLPSEPYAFSEQDFITFAPYPDLPAVRDGRLHPVDGSWLTWPGTRLAQALAELPSVINPSPVFGA